MDKENEELKDEQTNEEETDQDGQEQAKPDKPVDQSTFNKYREAFLREQLSQMNVNKDEMDAAIQFVDERADDTDSNLDDVFRQLKVRMRLNERKSYIDPSPMTGHDYGRPRPKNKTEIGRKAARRLMQEGKIK